MSRRRFNLENSQFQRLLRRLREAGAEEEGEEDGGATGGRAGDTLQPTGGALRSEPLQVARANPDIEEALAAARAGLQAPNPDPGFCDAPHGENLECQMGGCALSDPDPGVQRDEDDKGEVSELLEGWTEETLMQADEDGNTLLHTLIEQGRQDLVLQLLRDLKNHNVINVQNNRGRTCLHVAVLHGLACLVRQLVLYGSGVHVRDDEGNTPLHVACARGELNCVRCLTQNLVPEVLLIPHFVPFTILTQEMDTLNYAGRGCVHLAAAAECESAVVHLVNQLGADVNLQEGTSGMTALHEAAGSGHNRMLACLIERCGANVHAKTYDRWTAADLAVSKGQTVAAEILRRAGARVPETVTWESEVGKV